VNLYKPTDYAGDIDDDEKRTMVVNALASLENIAGALNSIARTLESVTTADDQGRAAIRVVGEFVGGDGDVTAGV